MSHYVFTHHYREFAPGDAVPATWTQGFIESMLAYHRVRKVEPESPKAIRKARRNKAVTKATAHKGV